MQTSVARKRFNVRLRWIVMTVISSGLSLTTAAALIGMELTNMIRTAESAQRELAIDPLSGLMTIVSLAYQKQGGVIRFFPVNEVTASLNEAVSVSKEINRVWHEGFVNAVAASPDGNWMAGATSDALIHLWNRNGELQGDPFGDAITPNEFLSDSPTQQSHTFNTLAFSPNSQWLLSGGSDGTLRLWNTGGRAIGVFFGHTQAVNSVAFSADGNWVVSGSDDGTVRLWRVETNGEARHVTLTQVKIFTGHQGAVTSVAFNPKYDLITADIASAGERWHHSSLELGWRRYSQNFRPQSQCPVSGV
ncbi:MAG: hypothetical protein HC881_20345 [Leptolyngbyaceae cyanobacterium SL_7_1]|nr:hypothetical protein [Leptolyngbyaceae cyanobacterium SL_7_1]